MDKSNLILSSSTLFCETPTPSFVGLDILQTLSKYYSEMDTNLAKTLKIDTKSINIKAKTKENVECPNTKNNIEAFCVVLIRR